MPVSKEEEGFEDMVDAIEKLEGKYDAFHQVKPHHLSHLALYLVL